MFLVSPGPSYLKAPQDLWILFLHRNRGEAVQSGEPLAAVTKVIGRVKDLELCEGAQQKEPGQFSFQ